MNTKTTTLENILSDYYGIGSHRANPTTVLWAAEKLADVVGVDEAKIALQKLNRSRHKAGVMPAYPDYGSRLF